jgi:hypothetical protein
VNDLAHPAATATSPLAEPKSPWTPAVVACVACIGIAGGSLTYGLAVGFSLPSAVPLLLLASGCMAAVRWKRAGVRHELRNQASSKIAEFGGGVYGAMAMATLLYLEAADLVSDVASAGSLPKFIGALDVGWLVEQMMESVGFAIRAGLWPWHWLSDYGMQTVLIAGGAAVALDALIEAVAPRYRAQREVPASAPS